MSSTPTRYVALLRGVNVGGVRIAMAELRALLEGAGFGRVRTVLASGNVLLDASADAAAVTARLEELLTDAFAYSARVLVLPLDEVRAALDGYPFERTADRHAYVLFTDGPTTAAELGEAAAALPDADTVTARGSLVYWTAPKGGTLDSPFGTLTGKKRDAFTTNRNLQTLEKILAAG